MTTDRIAALLGDEASSLLDHACTTIPRERLHLPGPDSVDRIFGPSDRNIRVLRSLQQLSRGRQLANALQLRKCIGEVTHGESPAARIRVAAHELD